MISRVRANRASGRGDSWLLIQVAPTESAAASRRLRWVVVMRIIGEGAHDHPGREGVVNRGGVAPGPSGGRPPTALVPRDEL